MRQIFLKTWLWALLCLSFTHLAQAQTKPAQKADLIGTWQVVAFFPGSFALNNPDSDLLLPSQIYGFYEDNHMRSLTDDKAKEFNYTLDELESRFGNRPQKLHYQVIEAGLVATTIDEKQQIGSLWQSYIATDDHKIEGLPTQKGDLIMGMIPHDKSTPAGQFSYIRVLRAVNR